MHIHYSALRHVWHRETKTPVVQLCCRDCLQQGSTRRKVLSDLSAVAFRLLLTVNLAPEPYRLSACSVLAQQSHLKQEVKGLRRGVPAWLEEYPDTGTGPYRQYSSGWLHQVCLGGCRLDLEGQRPECPGVLYHGTAAARQAWLKREVQCLWPYEQHRQISSCS